MAHKKGASSSRNGRDSRRSGWASSGSAARSSRPARSWSATRNQVPPGVNVGRGGDDTLFAKTAGAVEFGVKRGRKTINIVAAAQTTD